MVIVRCEVPSGNAYEEYCLLGYVTQSGQVLNKKSFVSLFYFHHSRMLIDNFLMFVFYKEICLLRLFNDAITIETL
jgi:hypothetical protein